MNLIKTHINKKLGWLSSITLILTLGINTTITAAPLNKSETSTSSTRTALLQQALNEPALYPDQKSINITLSQLTDNTGLVYLGGVISEADLSVYLTQLKTLLGEDYSRYRMNQANRDHSAFHLTLINPYEYQKIDQTNLPMGQSFKVTLLGLGKVKNDKQATYFVVAQSPDGQFFRQQFILAAKDFHITLGFEPNDIYGVSKGIDTLIQDDLK